MGCRPVRARSGNSLIMRNTRGSGESAADWSGPVRRGAFAIRLRGCDPTDSGMPGVPVLAPVACAYRPRHRADLVRVDLVVFARAAAYGRPMKPSLLLLALLAILAVANVPAIAQEAELHKCPFTQAAKRKADHIRASEPVQCPIARKVIRKWFRSGLRKSPGFLVGGNAWACGNRGNNKGECIAGLHGLVRFRYRTLSGAPD